MAAPEAARCRARCRAPLGRGVPPASRRSRAIEARVRVRPLLPEDAPLLAAVFDGLSPASRVARFLVPKRELTAAELRYFSDVDHHDHEALIAVTRQHEEPVGTARFIRDHDDPASAEVDVEVVDAWQNAGVGSMLVARLVARARAEDVRHITALISADNRRSQRLLRKMGTIVDIARDGATISYRVALPAQASASPQCQVTAPVPAGCA